MQPTNNKGNNGDEKARKLRYLPKETLMLNLGDHDTAKRCTKYLTNLEIISNHFSWKCAYSESIMEMEGTREVEAFFARASHT
jgi:hypothetical protein